MDTIFFLLGKPSKDKNPKSINSSSRKWDDSENSSKSSSNPDLDFDHSNCKIHQLKIRLIILPTIFRITENYQFRAFSKKTEIFSLLPENIRLLKTAWKYPTVWKLPKNISLLKTARKYQTAENCLKISDCLKIAQKY